jgi:formamidopyrimidine-DNA glycosylase
VPELIEVEAYRRQADAVVGRSVAEVVAPDDWYLKGTTAAELAHVLVGRQVSAARRLGKLLVLDLSGGRRLGLRFGMTGRLVIDGAAAIDQLLYSSSRDEPTWDRFGLRFGGSDGVGDGDGAAGDLVMRDPRRLGGVSLDPDEGRLGVDAATVTADQLAMVLRGRAALKATLLDQSRLAGLGNLLADEILWRAGLDPARPARSLPDEVGALSAVIRTTVDELTRRGGSHTGDLQSARSPGGRCPRDGALLQRRNIGGRTTISCPRHQG